MSAYFGVQLDESVDVTAEAQLYRKTDFQIQAPAKCLNTCYFVILLVYKQLEKAFSQS